MPVYEVFLKKDGRDEFRHAGALEAANDELAIVLSRESYLRRAEGDRLWLVRRGDGIVADPDFVAPNRDKPHRHHDGKAVAAHRKAAREAAHDPAAREAAHDPAAREAAHDPAAREAAHDPAAREAAGGGS